MKQLLIPRFPEPGAGIELRGEDFHYLSRVRRVRTGQVINVRCADGRGFAARVVACGTDHLRLEMVEKPADALDENGSPALHLIQGIPKGKKLEQVIRQACEIGVASITPLRCRNSVADLDERWDRKRVHLDAVMREAFQQSGAKHLPVLHDPLDAAGLVQHLMATQQNPVLFCHERELAQSSLHRYLDPKPLSVSLIIGPEGGLAPQEIGLFTQHGYLAVWLGPQVLRTETAAIVGLGVLSVLLREHGSWSSRTQD